MDRWMSSTTTSIGNVVVLDAMRCQRDARSRVIFRHTVATRMLEVGGDLRAVQEFLGPRCGRNDQGEHGSAGLRWSTRRRAETAPLRRTSLEPSSTGRRRSITP